MIRAWLATLALVSATSAAGAASGGACGDMVAKFDAFLQAHPNATGTLPQTVGAQLNRQPNAETVARAQKEGRAHLYDLLAKAKDQEKAGDEKGCRATLAEVEWMIVP